MKFLAVIAVGESIVIRTIEAGGKTVIECLKTKEKVIANIYMAHTQGISNEGL